MHFGITLFIGGLWAPIQESNLGDSIGSTWRLNLCATHNVEGDVGNQVEEKDADLEDRHPGVVKHVELLD